MNEYRVTGNEWILSNWKWMNKNQVLNDIVMKDK